MELKTISGAGVATIDVSAWATIDVSACIDTCMYGLVLVRGRFVWEPACFNVDFKVAS